MVYLVFDQILNLLLRKVLSIQMAQTIKKYLAIWSHWPLLLSLFLLEEKVIVLNAQMHRLKMVLR